MCIYIYIYIYIYYIYIYIYIYIIYIYIYIYKSKVGNCSQGQAEGSLFNSYYTIGQSSHNMYSNNILNFQESTTILNACTKKSGNLLNAPYM